MSELANNLAVAWSIKASRLAADHAQAIAAPAFFEAEYVAQLERDHANAVHWARFWSLEALS